MAQYRLKYTSKTDNTNTGYFVRRLKEGFKGCSLKWPSMARVLTEEGIEATLKFMEEQGELDHYVFEKEQVSAEEETL